MYHGDTNERQRSELHMVKREGGKGKMAVNRTGPFSSRLLKGRLKIGRLPVLVRFTAIFPFPLLSLPCVVLNVVFHSGLCVFACCHVASLQANKPVNCSWCMQVLGVLNF